MTIYHMGSGSRYVINDLGNVTRDEKELSRLSSNIKRRVLTTLLYLSHDPFIGEPLRGDFKGFYSLHLHPYRIVYQVLKERLLILIFRVRQRKDAFR